jgi:hypothetical protein
MALDRSREVIIAHDTRSALSWRLLRLITSSELFLFCACCSIKHSIGADLGAVCCSVAHVDVLLFLHPTFSKSVHSLPCPLPLRASRSFGRLQRTRARSLRCTRSLRTFPTLVRFLTFSSSATVSSACTPAAAAFPCHDRSSLLTFDSVPLLYARDDQRNS